MPNTDIEGRLKTLLGQMLVPHSRQELHHHNLKWLGRNIAIHNAEHPHIEEARGLITKMLRKKLH